MFIRGLNKRKQTWSSHRGSVVKESDQEPQGCRFDPWTCSVGELWCRWQMWLGSCIAVALVKPAAAAPIRPLAWDPQNPKGAALEKAKKEQQKKKKKERKRERENRLNNHKDSDKCTDE